MTASGSGPKRDCLLDFWHEHPLGNKYIHQYCLAEVYVPGDLEPHTVVKRLKKNAKGKKEILFDASDEWHRGNGHLGQERTWTYCKKKYCNVSQDHAKDYLKTCLTCMQKNLVTKIEKGSRKPIVLKLFCDRFQIDLVNFCTLWRRDPFSVLMHWAMTIKDHATRLTYFCALSCKHPDLFAYKLQEIFGAIGYPKKSHTDNGKEFTAKLILRFLCHLNPNVLLVTGRPRRPQDQGSVENTNKLAKRTPGCVLAKRRSVVLGSVAAFINSQHG